MSGTKLLTEGFKEFYSKNYQAPDACMPELVKNGANPDYFIIHCIDPRCSADTIFNAKPGTFFGDRVMAALVPPYEKGNEFAASLRYAIDYKKIKHLIVLGHTKCGGVEALVTSLEDETISGWMNKASPALQNAKEKITDNNHEALCEETEKQVILFSLDNLLTYPSVKKAIDENRITIDGWLFNMEEGAIYSYDPTREEFINISSPS
jgi:carbonic anhydrase